MDEPRVTHEIDAYGTIHAANEKGARLPSSLSGGLLGVARAWDRAEADEKATYLVPQLARQLLEYVRAVQALIPEEVVEDAFKSIGARLAAPVGNAKDAKASH